MRKTDPRGVRWLLASLVISCSAVAGQAGQPANAAEAELLRDFVHYVRIDRADLAKSFGEALLAKIAPPLGTAPEGQGLKLTEFVALLESSGELQRFEESAARAQRMGELESVASRLIRAYEQGKLEQARDPEQISRNIALLKGTQRQRLLARERLAFAGEYAVPQLLGALVQRNDPVLGAEVRRLLADMGRQSIAPLTAALAELEPAAQEQVAGVLGEIPYPASVPALRDLAASTGNDAVKAACARALGRIDGGAMAGGSVADGYAALADLYLREAESLTSFPGESHQLVWSYDPSSQLAATPVRTEVFHEAMALRMSQRALALDGADTGAVSSWLLAAFGREIDLPAGYADPTWGTDRRDAMFYAVAAGTRAGQRVLARALDDRDTPVARRAIAALERTTGVSSLTPGAAASGAALSSEAAATGERNALLEALRYPNRRVQYEAALALAGAGPTSPFEGSDRVVPLLGSAVRDAGAKYAAVVAGPEQQQSIGNVLRGLGYTLVPPGLTLEQVEAGLTDVPGVDVLVVQLPAQSTDGVIDAVRANARLSATPVLALLSFQGVQDLSPKYRRDQSVRMLREGADPGQQAEAIEQLVEAASGGVIGAEEAAGYRQRALAALRDLAVSGNPVLNVVDAAGPLVAAMAASDGALRSQIADVLSHVGDQRVQVALVDMAMATSDAEMIDLLGKATRSAKRYGNMLEDRQVRRLVALAGQGSNEQATSVAGLLGALNLPNENLVPLILNTPAK